MGVPPVSVLPLRLVDITLNGTRLLVRHAGLGCVAGRSPWLCVTAVSRSPKFALAGVLLLAGGLHPFTFAAWCVYEETSAYKLAVE